MDVNFLATKLTRADSTPLSCQIWQQKIQDNRNRCPFLPQYPGASGRWQVGSICRKRCPAQYPRRAGSLRASRDSWLKLRISGMRFRTELEHTGGYTPEDAKAVARRLLPDILSYDPRSDPIVGSTFRKNDCDGSFAPRAARAPASSMRTTPGPSCVSSLINGAFI